MDEFFETATLIQTKRIPHLPFYLFGKDYWSGLMTWLKETMYTNKFISADDLNLYQLTDDIDEIVEGITTSVLGNTSS